MEPLEQWFQSLKGKQATAAWKYLTDTNNWFMMFQSLKGKQATAAMTTE
ncbi:protein of unknown function [Candidatus Promineifilum breve]|uniref:Uncharacterized protein n=1 Tax=Candidatus Promineifilum breve TaxID=1806508 RepID=A0A160T4A9_9CHLR|nr:protein of unknown function [Candidatus Promineifilum breve]